MKALDTCSLIGVFNYFQFASLIDLYNNMISVNRRHWFRLDGKTFCLQRKWEMQKQKQILRHGQFNWKD